MHRVSGLKWELLPILAQELGMQSFWSEIGTFPYFSQGIWGPGFPEFCPESWGVDKNMGNTSSELTPFELFQWRNNSRKNEGMEQSKNNTQLWMSLVIEARSNAVKSNIA